MHMKHLLLTILILSFTLPLKAQSPQADQLKRAIQLREELHKRLMDHLFNGNGITNDDAIFKDMDTLFEDVMSDMQGSSFTHTPSRSYEMAWTESRDGRTLLLSPKDKNQPLEISVEKAMISIKGKTEVKTGASSMVSNFSHSYSVPGDVDDTKVKMLEKDGKILISFPFKHKPVKSPNNDRKPVAPSENDVKI